MGNERRNLEQTAIGSAQVNNLPPSEAALGWAGNLDLLSGGRKEELAERLWMWNTNTATPEQPGPFAHERLTGLEVFWLVLCLLAGRGNDVSATEQQVRTALRIPWRASIH